jgi:polysaccharide biosynthesis protein PslG
MTILRTARYFFLTFIVLSTLVLVGLEAATPRILRVGVHTIRPDAEHLARAADLGVDTVVQLFPWREVEATEGRFNWQMSDEAVAGAAYYGLHLLVRLDQPPDWAVVEVESPGQPPFDLAAYERFVRAVAERYQGQVAGYIIWNEPNLALEWAALPPDPAAYVELLRAGYRAVTAGDPDALVISAGLAPTNTNNDLAMDDRRFLEEMYEHGVADLFHVLGAHAYGFGHAPDAPFVDPAESNSDLAGLVFARLPLLRQIMVRYGDRRKPIYVTEMGWTVEGMAHSGWQGVTPEQQAEYLLDAFQIARQQWPWLALMTVWNVGGENDPEWQGYSLLQPDGQPRAAYYALQKWLQDAHPTAVRGEPAPPADRYQVLAADVTVHLGDTEMPVPWAPLYKGRPRSPHWEGVVYVADPGEEAWKLTLRIMQSNFWSNRVWINGEPLPAPMPIDDFSKSWIAHTWTIPAGKLRPGPNRIAVTLAHSTPLIQAERFTYDDLQIKDIVLWRGN